MESKRINEMSDKGEPVLLFCKKDNDKYLLCGIRGNINEIGGIEYLLLSVSKDLAINGTNLQSLHVPCKEICACISIQYKKLFEAYFNTSLQDPYSDFKKEG